MMAKPPLMGVFFFKKTSSCSILSIQKEVFMDQAYLGTNQ